MQGVCSPEVYLTRSERIDDAPSVPARWLQRLDTFLTAIDIDRKIIHKGHHIDYSNQLDDVPDVKPVERPAPTPPISARPQKLSVTKIEKWLQDPYSIYASEILKLRKLDALEKEFDAAERGTVLHDVMDQFTTKYPKNIPDSAQEDFVSITKDILTNNHYDESIWNFWKPRITKLSEYIIPHEKEWREAAKFGVSEAKGTLCLSDNLKAPFTLTARADRIDHLHNGTAAIIDYKSGGTYSKVKLETAEFPQLPLEGLILQEYGFAESGFPAKNIGSLSYWKLTGGNKAVEITELDDDSKIEKSILLAKEGLTQLIQTFENKETAYLAIPNLDNAPRFNDYAHLERVKEWAAIGENNNDVGEAA